MLKLFRARRAIQAQPSSQSEAPFGARHCPHGLHEFSTPNSNFQCDICRQHVSAWTTMWGCRECNYDECESCYAVNSKPIPDTSKPGLASAHSSVKRDMWNCKACTFENPIARDKCEMCEQPKPVALENHMTDLTCAICLDAPRQVAFVECGHFVACEKCANTILAMPQKQCLICRTQLKARPMKIYLS